MDTNTAGREQDAIRCEWADAGSRIHAGVSNATDEISKLLAKVPTSTPAVTPTTSLNIANFAPAEGVDEEFIPVRQTPGSAGFDVRARLAMEIAPGATAVVPLGFHMSMIPGVCALIKGRSGLAARHGLCVLGGLIDSDYRGEVGAILLNTQSSEPFVVEAGQRIAQLLFVQNAAMPDAQTRLLDPNVHFEVCTSTISLKEYLRAAREETDNVRATGGFGSTGLL